MKEDSLKNILIKHIVTKRFGDEKLKRVEKVKARKQQNIEQNKLEKQKEAEKKEEK